jgi:phosphohistidine phosphatase
MESKSILLLRHGKSDWDAGVAADHERPLAPRGEAAARRVGAWLSERGAVPQLVLTSDAVRARTTVEIAAQAGAWDCEIRLRPDFYGGGPEALVQALVGLDESVHSVLLAGHQPTWGLAVARLAGGGQVHFPTAALACLGYVGAWRNLAPGRCELAWLVTPKLLG